MANAKFGRNKAGKRAPSNANQAARTKANKERNIKKDAAMKKAHAEKQAKALSKAIKDSAISGDGTPGHATPAQAKHNLRMWKRSKRSHAQQPKHNHRFDNTIACRMLHQQTDLPCDASNFHKVVENVQFAINAKH